MHTHIHIYDVATSKTWEQGCEISLCMSGQHSQNRKQNKYYLYWERKPILWSACICTDNLSEHAGST